MDSVHTPDNVVLTSPPFHITSGEEEKGIAPTTKQEISIHSTTETIKTTDEEENPKIITRGTYDGEISFGSSWKNVGSSRGIGEIGSIIEDDAEKLPKRMISRLSQQFKNQEKFDFKIQEKMNSSFKRRNQDD